MNMKTILLMLIVISTIVPIYNIDYMNNNNDKVSTQFEIYLADSAPWHYAYDNQYFISINGNLITAKRGSNFYFNNTHDESAISEEEIRKLTTEEIIIINEYLSKLDVFTPQEKHVMDSLDVTFVFNKTESRFAYGDALDENINKLIEYVLRISPVEIKEKDGKLMPLFDD